MYRRCVFCPATGRDENIKFHRFPAVKSGRQAWIKSGFLKSDPGRSSHVCGDHFLTTDYRLTKNGKWCLRADATPTVFRSKRKPKREPKKVTQGTTTLPLTTFKRKTHSKTRHSCSIVAHAVSITVEDSRVIAVPQNIVVTENNKKMRMDSISCNSNDCNSKATNDKNLNIVEYVSTLKFSSNWRMDDGVKLYNNMNDVSCAAPGCNLKSDGGIKFYHFLRSNDWLQSFIKALKLDNYDPAKHTHVCRTHYSEALSSMKLSYNLSMTTDEQTAINVLIETMPFAHIHTMRFVDPVLDINDNSEAIQSERVPSTAWIQNEVEFKCTELVESEAVLKHPNCWNFSEKTVRKLRGMVKCYDEFTRFVRQRYMNKQKFPLAHKKMLRR